VNLVRLRLLIVQYNTIIRVREGTFGKDKVQLTMFTLNRRLPPLAIIINNEVSIANGEGRGRASFTVN
jgi:hypothetical protein